MYRPDSHPFIAVKGLCRWNLRLLSTDFKIRRLFLNYPCEPKVGQRDVVEGDREALRQRGSERFEMRKGFDYSCWL